MYVDNELNILSSINILLSKLSPVARERTLAWLVSKWSENSAEVGKQKRTHAENMVKELLGDVEEDGKVEEDGEDFTEGGNQVQTQGLSLDQALGMDLDLGETVVRILEMAVNRQVILSDSEKILLASAQLSTENTLLRSRDINDYLKEQHLAVSNTTTAIARMAKQRNPWMVVVEKQGGSIQAQKLYKITPAGIEGTKKLLSKVEDII